MKGRITLLSTKRTTIFKVAAFLFWITIPCGMVTLSIYTSYDLFFSILIGTTYGIMSFKSIVKVLRLKSIAYDDSYIYIKLEGYIQEISLEEIRDINLKEASGIYCLQLDESHGRRKIYFKSSLWYPFNFKKVDQHVNEFSNKIQQARMGVVKEKAIEPETIRI